MGKSYKKKPGGGNCSSRRQKEFKVQEHQAERKIVRQQLTVAKALPLDAIDPDLPHPKEFGNEWSSPRDGKQYWIDHDKDWMRK